MDGLLHEAIETSSGRIYQGHSACGHQFTADAIPFHEQGGGRSIVEQAPGALVCGKCYPGHRDTANDAWKQPLWAKFWPGYVVETAVLWRWIDDGIAPLLHCLIAGRVLCGTGGATGQDAGPGPYPTALVCVSCMGVRRPPVPYTKARAPQQTVDAWLLAHGDKLPQTFKAQLPAIRARVAADEARHDRAIHKRAVAIGVLGVLGLGAILATLAFVAWMFWKVVLVGLVVILVLLLIAAMGSGGPRTQADQLEAIRFELDWMNRRRP